MNREELTKASERNIISSRLRCPLEISTGDIFFSLVDYRNSLFTSNDPAKIIEFYNGFENRDQLIQWMKERPKGASYIREVDGDKDIVVVITTADFNGKYAKECRENIFKGLHIVFVESGGRGDFYFNIAHNINIGMKMALEYNPKWIVFSSDDMYKIDSVNVLSKELLKINPVTVDLVYTNPSKYHSVRGFIGSPNLIHSTVTKAIDNNRKTVYKMIKRFCGSTQFWPLNKDNFVNKLMYRKLTDMIWITDFSIFSGSYVAKVHGSIYDETYINSEEDADLSVRLLTSKRYTFIEYQIGDYVGSTLGMGVDRFLRSVAGISYLSYKIKFNLLPYIPHFSIAHF